MRSKLFTAMAVVAATLALAPTMANARPWHHHHHHHVPPHHRHHRH